MLFISNLLVNISSVAQGQCPPVGSDPKSKAAIVLSMGH